MEPRQRRRRFGCRVGTDCGGLKIRSHHLWPEEVPNSNQDHGVPAIFNMPIAALFDTYDAQDYAELATLANHDALLEIVVLRLG
jgi:hypothetical protein